MTVLGIDRAGVIGLGLIGGSLARELHAAGVEVLGWDADAASLSAAEADGVVRALTPDLSALASAQLVVVAVPVTAAPALLARLAPVLAADCVVMDVGSTKRSIARAAVRAGIADRFVGSHPMAGDHRAGWAASHTGLFRGATVHLCPTEQTLPAALARVRALWTALAAATQVGGAAEHDRLVAWSSHLPQLLSSALAGVLANAGVPASTLGPGGRDVTRLAASEPTMWTAIVTDNADEIGVALEALELRVREIKEAVAAGDAGVLRELLETARSWRA